MTVLEKVKPGIAKRLLGKSGIPVSEIGLGCGLIGKEYGVEENIRAFSVLAAADNCGINFWDTADIYGNGLSESRLGAWQTMNKGRRLIATKAGRSKELYPDRHQYDRMYRSIEGSLSRLQVDCLEVLHLHRLPEKLLQGEQLWSWLDDFKRQGLVKHFGACVDTMDEALSCIDRNGLTSIEVVINVFHQGPVEKLFSVAAKNAVAVVARQPFAHGLFDGAIVSATSEQKKAYGYLGRSRLQQRNLLQKIRALVPKGMTLEQMALRWLLDFNSISSVLIDSLSVEQIKFLAKVSKMPALSEELRLNISRFYDHNIRPYSQ